MKKNIIHSVQVEINTTSLATATAIKSSIDDVIKNQILPHIERLLEQYQMHLDVHESLQIDELELDVTIEKGELNSTEMVSALAEQFERSLINIQKQKAQSPTKMRDEFLIDVQHPLFSTRSFSHSEKSLESFFFFVRTGTKPWWIPNSRDLNELLQSEKLFEIIATNKTEFALKLNSEIQIESSRKRIITQFSDEILIQFIKHIHHALTGNEITSGNVTKIAQIINSNNVKELFRTAIWEFILLQFAISTGGIQQLELKPLTEKIFRSFIDKVETLHQPDSSAETGIKKMIESIVQITEPIVQIIFLINNQPIPKQIQSEIKTRCLEFMQRNDIKISSKYGKSEIQNREKIAQLDASEVAKSLEKTVQKERSKELLKAQGAITIPAEGLHFDHAGLVLLYPFLGHFFKHIELIDTNQNLTDPELAAHILHYIATGKENDWEFDMVFEKYLVGIPMEEPILKNRLITDSVKEEVDSMLKAVKSNWKPMMNTSNELLQYEFLQRPGKLVVDGHHHRIVMEKKTQDILLSQLTWTISIVRFPWRDELLYVEW